MLSWGGVAKFRSNFYRLLTRLNLACSANQFVVTKVIQQISELFSLIKRLS
jgi:hypothetical protein